MPPILLLTALALLLSCSGNTFTDERDGKEYKVTNIGTQIWMAENLNYEAEGSKCYNNNPANCKKYGRLYDWQTALKACPNGWHLPKNIEWDKLYRFVDGTLGKGSTESPYKSETAGKFLKATSGWNENGNGEDKFEFAALPSGYGRSDGYFGSVGTDGTWWSASESNAYYAYYQGMNYYYEYANWLNLNKTYLFSVRCVRD